MQLLLDTHALLWWLFDDPKLSATARKHLANPDYRILVSAASVWEISTKHRLGKLPEADEVARDVPAWIEKARFDSLAVTAHHAQLAGTWDVPHRDPFDRMLAAQSRLENAPLVTVDGVFAEFGSEVVW